MALEIKRNELTAGYFQSVGPNNTASQWTNTFEVKTDVLPNATEDIAAVDHVVTNENLYVNETAFVDITETKYVPWSFCSSLRSRRHPARRDFFEVMAGYSVYPKIQVKQTDLELIDLPEAANEATVTDEYPILREHGYVEGEEIIWDEAVSSGANKMALPTGSLFSEPFKRQFPERVMRQTQFEIYTQSFEPYEGHPQNLFDNIEERLFSINNNEWAGDDVATGNPTVDQWYANPPRWKVTQIDFQKVRMPYIDTGTGTLDWTNYTYMMTYTLQRTSRPFGWLDARALIDYYVLTTANDLSTKIEYRSPVDGHTILPAYLNADGTARADQDLSTTNGKPTYGVWITQPMIPFQINVTGTAGFLRPQAT